MGEERTLTLRYGVRLVRLRNMTVLFSAAMYSTAVVLGTPVRLQILAVREITAATGFQRPQLPLLRHRRLHSQTDATPSQTRTITPEAIFH